jgi:hypothetical protein
VIIFRLDS